MSGTLIIVLAFLVGVWRAWDGNGAYVRSSTVRVAILFVILAAMAALGLPWQPWPEQLLGGVFLVAGVTWSLQRGFDDWTQPRLVMPHFAFPISMAVAPTAILAALEGRWLVAAGCGGYVLLCACSGLAFAYEGQLFGKLPHPTLGRIPLDAHRYAEAVNGWAHGFGLAGLLVLI